MLELIKEIFIYLKKDLSSSFHLWNRENLKKIKAL
jgi:hypothetical protein